MHLFAGHTCGVTPLARSGTSKQVVRLDPQPRVRQRSVSLTGWCKSNATQPGHVLCTWATQAYSMLVYITTLWLTMPQSASPYALCFGSYPTNRTMSQQCCRFRQRCQMCIQ